MLNLRPSSFLALTVFALGCGSNVVNVSPDAGPGTDVSAAADTGAPTDRSPPPDVSNWCVIGSGQGICQVGHTCPHPDGCNTCTCYGGSQYATCTTIGCAVPDAGPALDVPGSCTLPSGATCRQGETCPAGDHCNTCVCSGATGTAVCTAHPCVARPDAGPDGCYSNAECGGGRQCTFSTPGCDVAGTCGPITDCAAAQPYCSCGGTTFLACPSAPDQNWVTRGECATDGGVMEASAADVGPAPDSAACAGASIGPSGSYCAGPDDGPLPNSCCTGWVCDDRRALCNSLPGACPPGEVRAVVGACYGPCVPAPNCAPIPCGTGGCPHGWTCDTVTARCRFGA